MASLDARLLAQLEAWRKDLINLTRSNRLLYLRLGSVVEIVEPGAEVVFAQVGSGLEVAEPLQDDLLSGVAHPRLRTNQVRLAPLSKSTPSAKLRLLDRNATQTFMDRGLWVLYLGFGLLEWEDAPPSGGAAVKSYSPLLLVPVTVKRDSPTDPFTIRRNEEEQRFNPALIAKLEEDFGITLALPSDEDELEPRELFRSINEQVAKRGWRVLPRTVLSTFSFHKEPIVRDLTANQVLVLASEAVRGLALSTESDVTFEFDPIDELEIDQAAPPEQTVTIRDADASQRRAIAAAANGQSFVMDGPPGTGKSQTIANMIADLLARQKSVLFVSDKAAALDVVFDRLDEAGITEFVLQLHSHKATRKEVAKALGKSLQTRVKLDEGMSQSDRDLLRRKREQLSNYAAGLNMKREPLDRSLHQVIGAIAKLQHLPQAPPPKISVLALEHVRFAHIIDLAESLGRAWGPVARRESFHWFDLVPGDWDAARRVRLTATLEAALAGAVALRNKAALVSGHMLLPAPDSLLQSERLHAVENLLLGREYAHGLWLTMTGTSEVSRRLNEASVEADRLKRLVEGLAVDVGSNWRNLDSAGPQALQSAIRTAKATEVRPDIADSSTSGSLQTVTEKLETASNLLGSFAESATPIALLVDLDPSAVSRRRATELARLALMARAEHLPEASWLAPVGLAKVRSAVVRLRPLLSDVKRWDLELQPIFTRQVLALDLETLCIRFEGAYRSFFRWLNAEYRRDRRLLKACTRSGRWSRRESSLLGSALKWQRAVQMFKHAALEDASLLGHFANGESTDFDAIESACEVAERAMALAGTWLLPGPLARLVAWDANPPATIHNSADALSAIEPRWNALEVDWAGLDTCPINEATRRAEDGATAVKNVVEHLERVDLVVGRTGQLTDALQWLADRRDVEAIEDDFGNHQDSDVRLMGSQWHGVATDWRLIARGIAWADSVVAAWGSALERDAAERIASMDVQRPQLGSPLGTLTAELSAICLQFQEKQGSAVRDLMRGPFGASLALITALLESIDDIDEWYAYVRATEALRQEGLNEAVRFCVSKRVASEVVRSILERAVLESWADDVFRTDPRMSSIRAEDQNALTQDFRKLDRKLVQLAARQTIEACSKRRPTNFQGAAGIVLSEAEKQRKHMPVRDLMRKAREVIQAVKPCFMMSPLSVSQFLPAEMTFDVVIFDEASQVRPADAISSIYRGKQLIVAGDQKQLPPTSFFERMEDGEDDAYEEDEPDRFESILDLCKGSGVFTSLPLRWHYRSQHEHLIAYSNQNFYDGTLITFPGATSDAPDMGVEVFHCPSGIYRRGGARDNPLEAALVGERVLFHAKHHPGVSIGVVAFSEAQASAIDAVIEKLSSEHGELAALGAEDRLNGLFVKNLETVQGDERDIIVFSMGYGRDEAGKFTMNFGPLTKSGGHRRLNVAITRARRKVEFVTSVRTSDFSGDLTAEGARHLRKYLEYAERKDDRMAVLAIPLTPNLGDFESPFEAEVGRVVRSWGYDVVPQVGCSGYRIDLGVRSPEDSSRFVLGIECDGAMYHSSRAARDRDRLRQEVLQRLGWRLHRIWGPAWYRTRVAQEVRLRAAIDEAIRSGPEKSRANKPARSKEELRTQTIEWNPNSMPSWAATYASARLPRVSGQYEMHDVRAREDLRRVVLAVITAEGPVHVQRVLRRARAAFGVERAGKRIQDAFVEVLDDLKAVERKLRHRGEFLWLEGLALQVRAPDDRDVETTRPVTEVAPQELERAVLRTVRDALRIERDELGAYVARLFGWDRSGSRIETAIREAVKALLRREELRADGDSLLPKTSEA